jgi:hypothetical protein
MAGICYPLSVQIYNFNTGKKGEIDRFGQALSELSHSKS